MSCFFFFLPMLVFHASMKLWIGCCYILQNANIASTICPIITFISSSETSSTFNDFTCSLREKQINCLFVCIVNAGRISQRNPIQVRELTFSDPAAAWGIISANRIHRLSTGTQFERSIIWKCWMSPCLYIYFLPHLCPGTVKNHVKRQTSVQSWVCLLNIEYIFQLILLISIEFYSVL